MFVMVWGMHTTVLTRISSLEWQRFEQIGAWLTLLGVFTTLFGLSWDIQWHSDVGPDTFWTVPHLFVYAGAALTGVACLTTVLLCTQTARQLKRRDWVRVFGIFSAPIGFIVAGFGAFGFLLFGLFDQWWHTVFGFDAVLSSPPHVGLLLSNVMSVVGCAIIFGIGSRQRLLEMVLALMVALGFSLPILMATVGELGWIPLFLALPALILPFGMAYGVSVSRQVWMALYVMLAFSLFRWVCWFLFPIITQAYADSLGLALRDTTQGVPQVPYLMPMLAPIAGLVFAGLLHWAKLRGSPPIPMVVLAGGLSAVVLYLDGALIPPLEQPLLLIPALLVGMLAAWWGWQSGVVMRNVHLEAGA
jgi:hypothetical protein